MNSDIDTHQRIKLSPEELIEEQKRIEAGDRDYSIQRFHKEHIDASQRHRFGETLVGRKVLDTLVRSYAEALDGYLATSKESGGGTNGVSYKMISQFDDTLSLSYIFTKAVLNLIPLRISTEGRNGQGLFGAKRNLFILQSTDMIHDELRLRYFNSNYPAIMRQIVKQADVRALSRHRRRELFKKEFDMKQLDWRDPLWGSSNRVHLGMRLLNIFMDVTGMLTLEAVPTGRNKVESMIFITQEFEDLVSQFMKNNEDIKPLYSPMVTKPRPWANDRLVGSSYLTNNVAPYRMIKRSKTGYIRDLELTNLSTVITAVNAVQETGWRVNQELLEAIEWAYGSGLKVDGIPLANNAPIPPKIEGVVKGSDEYKQLRSDAALVHRMNRKLVSKRISFLSLLGVAKKFRKYEAIYFPHDMDSRGRMYPKPTFLNPQGPAHVKALLEFSEGKPLETMEEVNYLAIAGANTYGLDKMPLEDRIEWVFSNEDLFDSIATDWRTDLRWTEADSPFEFLRFCLEWKALGDHGPGYLSHMPINFDATCSGLQHFSAILKDEIGGFNVNLTSAKERQDIYQAVADRATETIQAVVDKGYDPEDPHRFHLAQVALEVGITRALAKRPVMIVPYSGTFKACMNYVELYYKEGFESGRMQFRGLMENDISIRLVPFVARHVWDAISNTVVAARQAMDWIKVLSKEISNGSCKDKPILWTTPAGFTVSQFTPKTIQKRVVTHIDGYMQVKFREDTKELDPRKTSSSISPNFIHSMDAAHLQLTVEAAVKSGRNMSFSMIHDSFGVHAADMKYFVDECIKPCFYEMYKDGKALDRFLDQVRGQIDDDAAIPAIPPLGNLDLEEVLQSEFFFS